MPGTQAPQWRTEPKAVEIKCDHVRQGNDPAEFIVQFRVRGAEFTAFVPKKFVNSSNKVLKGFIVADVDGDWLVDLPVETLTSGSRIRVHKNDQVILLGE